MSISDTDACPCGSGLSYGRCHATPNHLDSQQDPTQTPSSIPVFDGKPVRECGGCTACCEATRINHPKLVKQKDETCTHVCAEGCAIWTSTDKPSICTNFRCNYLIEKIELTERERPDHVGAIVHNWDFEGILLVEYHEGGLINLLHNPVWSALICQAFKVQRLRLTISFRYDPYELESLAVKWFDDHIRCELRSCDASGGPVLVPVHPVHGTPLQQTQLIPDQEYAFDSRDLFGVLGEGDRTILSTPSSPLCFTITRRQVQFLQALTNLQFIGT